MRPGSRKNAEAEPGLLGHTLLKKYRRAETRKKQSQKLLQLRIQYRAKVQQERKTRAQLNDLETRIKKLERTLNHRAFEFTQIFNDLDAGSTTGIDVDIVESQNDDQVRFVRSENCAHVNPVISFRFIQLFISF
jgi:Tfp pilus assembly protein PilO